MVARIARMSIAERQRYVRWWMDESGLAPGELRRLALAVWGDREHASDGAVPDRRRSRVGTAPKHDARLQHV
jgi:hypothetical protein